MQVREGMSEMVLTVGPGHSLQGNLGTSAISGAPVTPEVRAALGR